MSDMLTEFIDAISQIPRMGTRTILKPEPPDPGEKWAPVPPDGAAIDAWIGACPVERNDRCPCGCGLKMKKIENLAEHEARFIANFGRSNGQGA